ncbi:hypothetical protein BDP81DRAFT_483716 [Colletotrichum phormii]|uniref:Uncharacterized protein n=1 Tax=Colletotrichum phormii TaxID=359342 RepID=A0AAI9ZIW5_9PEZI|nr:uncharacterized protein BDP81DRAFT_483716 [Colletotrichum phormii]KAK1625415.1 hypothetical protein BDP81DRAFT_483716 [Colletotrichum phormii]
MIELKEPDVQELLSLLWGPPKLNDHSRYDRSLARRPCGTSAYTNYCHRQWGLIAGYFNGHYIALNSLAELNSLIQYLLSTDAIARDQLHAYFGSNQRPILDQRAVDTTINLTLRLLLMLRFGPVEGEASLDHHLLWDSGCLKDCIRAYLEDSPHLNVGEIRFPKNFNAWSLVTIGGIKIELTDNLADHLLLIEDENDMRVLIFHHVSFLRCHQSSFYPQGLGASGTLPAEARRIERFNFWRNRLVVLKQAYDDATPRTLSQWWHDRRNRVVWCTFWLAILVLVLGALVGIVQCVQGGLQVSKS